MLPILLFRHSYHVGFEFDSSDLRRSEKDAWIEFEPSGLAVAKYDGARPNRGGHQPNMIDANRRRFDFSPVADRTDCSDEPAQSDQTV